MPVTFELPKIFHVSHVVDDLDAAVAWYDDVFSPRVWQRSELFGTSLALLCVGDVVMMPMTPPAGTATAPARFRERFGQRLHSLALYVDQPAALIEHLGGLGLHLTGSRGTPIADPQDEIWTQPRQTPLVLEFFQPRESMGDPRLLEPGWSADYWRHEHPMGIIGACCTAVTADLDGARRFLQQGLGGRPVHDGTVAAYATRSAFVALSDEVLLEVAEPQDPDSRAARDLASGGTFHAVTFLVADLDRAAAHVASKGIRTERPAAGHVVLDPDDSFGALIRLTDRPVAEW